MKRKNRQSPIANSRKKTERRLVVVMMTLAEANWTICALCRPDGSDLPATVFDRLRPLLVGLGRGWLLGGK